MSFSFFSLFQIVGKFADSIPNKGRLLGHMGNQVFLHQLLHVFQIYHITKM